MNNKEFQEKQLRVFELSIEIEECIGYPNIGYSKKGNKLHDLIQESRELLKKLPIVKEEN